VLVGINLLREGLDLPEVSLVAILDADKEGFLRSGTSLVQTIGRAARNVSGRSTCMPTRSLPSMAHAIDETNRRRAKQVAYNTERPGSIRSRCATRSTTSWTTSTARPRTPRARWPGTVRVVAIVGGGGRQMFARQGAGAGDPVPGPGQRRTPTREGMARVELSKLIQESQRPDAGCRPGVAVRAGGRDP